MSEPPGGRTDAGDLRAIDLDAVLSRVLAEHGDTVAAWLRDEPGSWGALAGQGILAARKTLGRRLTEAERRAVWQRLWDRLTALRGP